jgi:hypothetical protein
MTAAFNSRDLDAFGNFLKDDFAWLRPDGTTFIDGKVAFLAEVAKYWQENPDVKSELSEPIVLGNFVSQAESTTGNADGSTDHFLWVYEFDGHVLAKQWGFQPAK